MSDAVRLHKDRGSALLLRGKLPAALEEFKKVVEAVPGELGARQKVAEILARMGKKDDAIAEYTEVVNRYADAGQFFKATALCKVILGLDPRHSATQASLAKLYAGRRPSSPAPVPDARPTAPTAPLELNRLIDASRDDDDFELHVELPPEAPAPAPTAPRPLDPEVAAFVDLDIESELPAIPPQPEVPPPPPADLPAIPLFSDLSREQFVEVLQMIEPKAYLPGEAIVTEGEAGDAMYAIAEGRVGVVRTVDGQPPRRVAEMREGDFFGEMALLSDAPRLATVVAEVPTVVLRLSRAHVDALVRAHPQIGAAIARFHQDRLLLNLLRSSPLLHPLPEWEKHAVAAHFQSRTYGPGEPIIDEGQRGGAVYLLLRGSARVFHRDAARAHVKYPLMREGDAFGEISVVLDRPATASVEAVGPVVLLYIPAGVFRTQVMTHPAVKAMVVRLVNERLERTSDLVSRQASLAADLRV